MNRIRDYCGFAAWFMGLGYIVLWPLASSDFSGKPFGAFIVCRQGVPSLLDLLCHSVHPLMLPPVLHVIGFLAAVFVTVRLLWHAVKRSRRTAGGNGIDVLALAARMPVVLPPSPRRQKPTRSLRSVKPRTHFGLRGMPH